MSASPSRASVDPAEVAKFEAMAAEWWDPNGKFRPLHEMNPCRLEYLTRQIAGEFDRDRTAPRPFEGLRILDIGCGGGLLAEPMARLGASVTGIDAAGGNIPVARTHAEGQGLEIEYRQASAETMLEEGRRFDVVMALEIVEHVADPAAFLHVCAGLTRPGGLFLVSTLNRTAKAFGAAILGAEWLLRWLPRGTHDWSKFLTPEELASMIDATPLSVVDRKGLVFDPLRRDWQISDRDLSVNYVMAATRTGG